MNVPIAVHRRIQESGSSPVEFAVLFPVLMLLLWGFVQGALYFFASQVVREAANSAVAAASSVGGHLDAGRDAAQEVLDQTGRATLSSPAVSLTSDGSQIVATVSATPITLVPGFEFAPLVQSASAPVERFTTVGGP